MSHRARPTFSDNWDALAFLYRQYPRRPGDPISRLAELVQPYLDRSQAEDRHPIKTSPEARDRMPPAEQDEYDRLAGLMLLARAEAVSAER